MPRIVIFLDLDDTILQTAPKCPTDQALTPAAFNRAGEVLSFMTRAQQRLLKFWRERATVIPVTGRTDSALDRVAITFTSWRITHHGAVIRQPDGALPVWWHDEIQPLLNTARPLLNEYAAWLKAHAATGGYRVSDHTVEVTVHSPRPLAGEGLGVRAVDSTSYPLTLTLSPRGEGTTHLTVKECLTYISIKSEDDDAALTRLQTQLLATGLPPELALHCNGSNLALMVKGAQKHDAVRRVTAELKQDGPLVTIGAGDSLTDLPFMQTCDFALVPQASQIQTETWSQYPP